MFVLTMTRLITLHPEHVRRVIILMVDITEAVSHHTHVQEVKQSILSIRVLICMVIGRCSRLWGHKIGVVRVAHAKFLEHTHIASKSVSFLYYQDCPGEGRQLDIAMEKEVVKHATAYLFMNFM